MLVDPAVEEAFSLDVLNAEFDHRSALDIVASAVERYGDRLAVSTSFGADSAVMLHLTVQVAPRIKVISVDTGFLFPETRKFRDDLVDRLDLNLFQFTPAHSAEVFEAVHGRMWESNPNACCEINKQEPFERAKREQ